MTDAAYKVWEAFKAELIVEPTDDMKEALVTAIKELVSQCQYDNADWQAPDDEMIMDVKGVLMLANELEDL